MQRLPGEESAGQGEQDALGDVIGSADPPGGVIGTDLGEVVG
jgi:hypothetical protein